MTADARARVKAALDAAARARLGRDLNRNAKSAAAQRRRRAWVKEHEPEKYARQCERNKQRRRRGQSAARA